MTKEVDEDIEKINALKTTYCSTCEKEVWLNYPHSCYDAKALRAQQIKDKFSNVTRLEIIWEEWKQLVKWWINIDNISLQDDNRTLKIFINNVDIK